MIFVFFVLRDTPHGTLRHYSWRSGSQALPGGAIICCVKEDATYHWEENAETMSGLRDRFPSEEVLISACRKQADKEFSYHSTFGLNGYHVQDQEPILHDPDQDGGRGGFMDHHEEYR